jgi:hypothetical protein
MVVQIKHGQRPIKMVNIDYLPKTGETIIIPEKVTILKVSSNSLGVILYVK